MATEYTLSYTAKEIDDKLSIVTTTKNLLPYPFKNFSSTLIDNDIKFIDNGDGTITLNGTLPASSESDAYPKTLPFTTVLLEAGTYTINISPLNNQVHLCALINEASIEITQSYSFSITEQTLITLYFYLCLDTVETVFENTQFKPCIVAGNEPPSEWEPYISSISTFVDSRFNNMKNKLKDLSFDEDTVKSFVDNYLDTNIDLDSALDGDSAYEVAKKNGFEGSEEEWLDSLKGADGQDGKDGYTPVKGTDYFDGANGQDGFSPTAKVEQTNNGATITIMDKNGTTNATVLNGKDGQNGTDGKDGTSVTVTNVSESTADGGSNIITFGDGNTLTIKNGSKGSKGDKGDTGEQGENGADGYTPIKGVDYFTETDKEEIVQQVITALGTPVFGTVDANNNIILTGELADGMYTIKYEDAEGNVVEVGTITKEPPVELGWFMGSPARDSNTNIVYYSDPGDQTNYKTIYQTTGDIPLYTSADLTTATNYYPLVVPNGKTKMKLTLPNLGSNKLLMSVRAMTLDGNAYKQVVGSGWLEEGVYEWSFDAGTKYIIPFFRKEDYGGIQYYDISGATVSWE